MKKHLFYTFLTIFAATSVVTILGITGVVSIADGYLSSLVGAFLIELAGAAIAVFRTAKFFDDEEKEHDAELTRLKVVNEELTQKLVAANNLNSTHNEEIFKLTEEKQALAERLEQASLLRARILGVLGSESLDRSGILRALHIESNTLEGAFALAVIGDLVEENKIEHDSWSGGSNYRLRKT